MPSCIALIVAAGRGTRFKSEIPKQYLNLDGRTVLWRVLTTFAIHPGVDFVRVVIHHDDCDLYNNVLSSLKLLSPVIGGRTRQDSVRIGLESLLSDSITCDRVLIHDGARPFVDAQTITRVILALRQSQGAIAAIPLSDSIKRSTILNSDKKIFVKSTIDRTDLWQAQTPQGFHFPAILTAYQTADAAVGQVFTDDAAVAEWAGLSVELVPGSKRNIKITTTEDHSQRHVNNTYSDSIETRVGNGFDVHRFIHGGDGIHLCGVKIPYNRTLVGHSDADVALHALTDALLGTIAAGDIGQHFPQSDERWKGISSDVFLRQAIKMVNAAGGKIISVDITILCEEPKINPWRLIMINNLSEIFSSSTAERTCISVKASTTEGLGFTGRGEGIAANATVTVQIYP